MLPEKNRNLLLERKNTGNFRQLTPRNPHAIDFYSNDYLGIANTLQYFAPEASHSGATGSRLISGNSAFYKETEAFLAYFYQSEAALLFNSGYTANLALLSCLPQRGDTILYDELIHASLRDGIRLSHAKSYKFRHNDENDLNEKILHSTGAIFVVAESVYSMDGDCISKEILEICKEKNLFFIIDEAHATGLFGTLGKGFFEQEPYPYFARIHTFGKALGTHGAVIVGTQELIDFLINFSRPFIYTTAMSDAHLEIINYAHNLLLNEPERRLDLQKNIRYFRQKIQHCNRASSFLHSTTPIQGLLGDPQKLTLLSNLLQENNIAAKPIFYPTVSQGKERIRLTLHSYNQYKEIDLLFELIEKTQ